MKFFIVLALAAACYADQTAQIVRSESQVDPDGYKYSYETSNGIAADEQGVLTNPNSENAALHVQGQFSYPGEDGRPVQLSYVADENGFQPQGDHLPQAPPVPEAILRSIAYNAAHASSDDKYQPQQQKYLSAPPQRFPAPSAPFRSNKPYGRQF